MRALMVVIADCPVESLFMVQLPLGAAFAFAELPDEALSLGSADFEERYAAPAIAFALHLAGGTTDDGAKVPPRL